MKSCGRSAFSLTLHESVMVAHSYSYKIRPVLSATIHPEIKRTHVAILEWIGMTVSQVAYEVLYTGLIEMQELDAQR